MFQASFQVSLYYNMLFVVVIFTSTLLALKPIDISQSLKGNKIYSVLLAVFCIIFIGYREWWVIEVFHDSLNYGEWFLEADWKDLSESKDIGFNLFYVLLSKSGIDVNSYFIICACFYVIPLLFAVMRIDKKFNFILFLFVVGSLSFYSYGVNGIRNGIATSFVLLALTYRYFSFNQILCFLIACLFHMSAILPISCYLLSFFIKEYKYYYIIWILAIPISFLVFPVISEFIGSISFLNDRAGSYLSGEVDSEVFSKSGFRYDFLLYGALPIFINYFSQKRHLVFKQTVYKRDVIYSYILKTYILCNAFWILINQVPYSNRFAYLSWFMMPIVIAFPLIYYPPVPRIRSIFLSIILLFYYLITYLL